APPAADGETKCRIWPSGRCARSWPVAGSSPTSAPFHESRYPLGSAATVHTKPYASVGVFDPGAARQATVNDGAPELTRMAIRPSLHGTYTMSPTIAGPPKAPAVGPPWHTG